MVDHMAGGQLRLNVLGRDALLGHQHHHVIGQIRDLIDRLAPILGLGGDDDLGALLAHLFEDLVEPLVEQIAGVGALGPGLLPLPQQLIERAQAELAPLIGFPDGIGEAGVGAQVAGRPSPPSPAARPCRSQPSRRRCADSCRWSRP